MTAATAPFPVAPARRFRTPRVVGALMLREIALSNRRTIFGYLWEIVEPVAYIAILMAIFSLVFVRPPLGTSFALFYASGILRFSRQLLSYPEVTFLDAILARFLLAAATKLAVFALVIGLIVAAFGVEPVFDAPDLFLGLAMTLFLALAVGTLNCLLFTVFPLYESVWVVVTRPLFLVSAVLFQFDQVPLPWRDWLWWNPVIHLVGQVRAGLYPTYAADYVSVVYIAGVAAVILPVALFFLRRYWRDLVYGD
jgi:capsular polysaccharide transport system permease protein